jgi:protein phosphatase
MKITYSIFSEKGPRHENQDFIQTITDKDNGRYIFVLCDGMGGHAHGGLAARIVATSIARDIKQNPLVDEADIQAIITRASWTLDTMADVYGGAQMGTTMVMAYIDGDDITVMHCGDSRCYVYDHNYNVKYVTIDHNAGDYIGAPITRCFFAGLPEKATPDVKTFKISPGDRIFICSDGVYPCMAPDILRDRMMDAKPIEEIMDTFKFMCEKFSKDNYSGIMIKID